MTNGALPRRVPGIAAALVERDEEVGAAVAVGQREAGLSHLLAGRGWRAVSVSIHRYRGGLFEGGGCVRRGSAVVSEAMVVVSIGRRRWEG